jgi:catechol 2,3-dioxygenase
LWGDMAGGGGGGPPPRPLLILHGDPALAPRDSRQAGLFHTAFLMPDRADLGRWLAHVAQSGTSLEGASDHIVSEALYLSDPEGNGIEIYADRPVAAWRTPSGEVRMATDRLDLQDLLRAAGSTRWQGFPEEGSIGHVHLQVGDTGAADRFYRDLLGFDIAARYPGASFYGAGGYHHQLAGNVWHSRGAGPRPEAMAGLDRVELVARDQGVRDAILSRARRSGADIAEDTGAPALRDPWGTTIALAA